MEPVAESILCSIVATIIYDIGKCCLGKIESSKNKFNKKSVEEYVSDHLYSKYNILVDSGTLAAYLNEPMTKDTINNYVIYTVTGKVEGKLAIKGLIKKNKSQSIEEADIINFLTQNLLRRYQQDGAVCIPGKELIIDFFNDIVELSGTYIFEQMTQEETAMVYFINKKMNIMGNGVFTKLDDIIAILNKSIKLEYVDLETDFLEKKKQYIKTLKQYHKMAHIYLLDKFEINEFYVPPFLSFRDNMNRNVEIRFANQSGVHAAARRNRIGNEEIFSDWMHIFERNNIIYVTGGAGYGKSLFMKKLICEYEKLNILDAIDYIVIYGELKNFYISDREDPISVIDFLQNSMRKETLIDETVLSKELINYYLKRGRCLILLDALDEVDKAKRQKLHSLVINYFKNENPNNKICITSRARGFLPEKDIVVYEIEPLDSIQIKKYVDNIIKLGKFDESDREEFLQQTQILVEKRFLSSFLILSLLINIYKAERELPENKLELYQKCFEYISNRREKEKSQDKYDWSLISTLMKDNTFMELANLGLPNNSDISKEEIKSILTEIYKNKYVSENQTEQAIEQFLTFCSDRTELFVPSSGEDCFKFFHRSFFEYFYSQYIYTRKHNVEEICNAWQKFDVDSEVFELTLAMFKQKDEVKYQEIVEYIIERIKDKNFDRENRIAALNILILCMQVIDDELYKKEFVDFLVEKKGFCTKNIKSIYNQRLIVDVISSKEEFRSAIVEHYEDRIKFEAVSAFVKIFPEIEQYMKHRSDNDEIKNEFNGIGFAYYRHFVHNFYNKIYTLENSLQQFFEKLSLNEIEELCTKSGISRKESNKIQSRFKKYLALDSKLRKQIVKVMFAI